MCLLVAAGVMLAACSSDDGDDSDGTVATDPSVTEPTGTDSPDTTEAELTGEGMEIGVIAPSPGLLSTLFQGQTRGIGFAADDIAAGGGVLEGPIEVLTSDTPLDSTEADVVPTAVESGAQALIGPTGSSGADTYREAVTEAGTISCSASATVPGITAGQESFGLFRTALPDDVLVSYLADTIEARRDAEAPGAAWNVAIVARSDDYGLAIGNGLAYSLQVRGLQPSIVDYNPRRVQFTGTSSEVTSLDPQLTVVVSYEEGAPIVTELIRGGVEPTSIIGLDSFFRPRIASLSAPDGDVALVDGLTMIGTTGDRAFLERLYTDDPNGQIANAAQAYDCAVTLALATEAVNDGSSDSMSDAVIAVTGEGTTCTTYDDCLSKLLAGENIDYDGVSGRIAIDADGDPTFGRFTTATLADGTVGSIETTDVDIAAIRSEQAAFAAAAFNTKLQQALTLLGFYTGPINGLESPELTAALAAFQASVGLPPTGVMDEATYNALRAALGEYGDLFDSSTKQLQQLLTDLGYYDGPIDGIWTAQLTEAVKALQRDLGVPETGVLDAATVMAAYERGILTGSSTTTTAPPDTTAAPTTAAPTTAAPTTQPPTTPPPVTTVAPTVPPTTAPPTPPADENLWDLISADPDFSTFAGLLLKAGYDTDVDDPTPYTVFAPTNEAFAADPDLLAQLNGMDQAALSAFLAYYVGEGGLVTADMQPLPFLVTTLHGAQATVDDSGAGLTYDGAPISATKRDLVATNGVLQGLDSLFVPPSVPAPDDSSTPPVDSQPEAKPDETEPSDTEPAD